MSTIRLHLLREWSGWFGCSLFFLLGTIFLFVWVEDSGRIFPDGSHDWWIFLFLWILQYLPWLLPLCCLLASLFALAFLKKRGEWMAMQSNGISPFGSLLWVGLAGIAISVACGWLSKAELSFGEENRSSKIGSLKMRIGHERLWYFREFDIPTRSGTDVQLFCYGDEGEDLMRIRAESARWEDGVGWTFEKGRFLGFFTGLGLPVPAVDGKSIVWEKSSITDIDGGTLRGSKSPGINRSFDHLSGVGFEDDPFPHALLSEKPRNLGVKELQRVIEDYPQPDARELAPYRLRFAQIGWSGPACLIGLLTGLVLGISRFSSSPPKLAGIALLGSLAFYSIRTLSDSMGEQMILSPELAGSLPYFLCLLGLAFFLGLDRRN